MQVRREERRAARPEDNDGDVDGMTGAPHRAATAPTLPLLSSRRPLRPRPLIQSVSLLIGYSATGQTETKDILKVGGVGWVVGGLETGFPFPCTLFVCSERHFEFAVKNLSTVVCSFFGRAATFTLCVLVEVKKLSGYLLDKLRTQCHVRRKRETSLRFRTDRFVDEFLLKKLSRD